MRAPASQQQVIISTFPPCRDGIARYADQQARQLGSEVTRIGHPGSVADRTLRLSGWFRPLSLLRATRRNDHLILHWHPAFFLVGRRPSRILTWLSLAHVARRRATTVVVHEPTVVKTRSERRAAGHFWRSARTVSFHSGAEQVRETERFPEIARRSVVIEHSAHFEPAAHVDQAEAREVLGLERDVAQLLCIGFLGRHKGFDRAVRAFAKLPPGAARLSVVGSILYDTPELEQYVVELDDLVRRTPGAELRRDYVSDECFDLWLRAADGVILPYREISSSSVLARARIMGTPAIVTPVGALPEQAGASDSIVESDEALLEAMANLLTARQVSG